MTEQAQILLRSVHIWSPNISGQGPFGPVDAQRGHNIVDAHLLAFFDRRLKGEPVVLLDGSSARFPDVLVESRRYTWSLMRVHRRKHPGAACHCHFALGHLRSSSVL